MLRKKKETKKQRSGYQCYENAVDLYLRLCTSMAGKVCGCLGDNKWSVRVEVGTEHDKGESCLRDCCGPCGRGVLGVASDKSLEEVQDNR